MLHAQPERQLPHVGVPANFEEAKINAQTTTCKRKRAIRAWVTHILPVWRNHSCRIFIMRSIRQAQFMTCANICSNMWVEFPKPDRVLLIFYSRQRNGNDYSSSVIAFLSFIWNGIHSRLGSQHPLHFTTFLVFFEIKFYWQIVGRSSTASSFAPMFIFTKVWENKTGQN